MTLDFEIDGDNLEELGQSVAVSKGVKNGGGEMREMVIVGAPRSSKGTQNGGMAQVFYYTDFNRKWEQLGQNILGRLDEEFLGESVAISDDGMVICVGTGVGDSQNRGRVDVYKYDEFTSRWEEMGGSLNGQVEGARFGTSVGIVQTSTADTDPEKYYIAVGAPQVNSGEGVVQIFYFDIDQGIWNQLGTDLMGDLVQDQLGESISLVANKNFLYLAVGVPSAKYYGGDPNGDDDSSDGRVQVYRYDTSRTKDWHYFGDEIEQMDDADGTGDCVELSEDAMLLAIGSPNYNGGDGMVRVYEYNAEYDDYIKIGKTLYGKSGAGGGFGKSLSFSGGDLAVGAPYMNIVQIFEYRTSSKGHSIFRKLITAIIFIGVIGFVGMYCYKKLVKKGFKWSSFVAALPGISAVRRRGRSAVSTDDPHQNDEWPFPFFSAKDRERIHEVQSAEEGRGVDVAEPANVDRVVLFGMPKSAKSSDSSSASASGSEEDDDLSCDSSVHEMKQIA